MENASSHSLPALHMMLAVIKNKFQTTQSYQAAESLLALTAVLLLKCPQAVETLLSQVTSLNSEFLQLIELTANLQFRYNLFFFSFPFFFLIKK